MYASVVPDETGFSKYAYSILAESWAWPLERMATNHPPLIPYQLAVLTSLFGGSLEIFRLLSILYGSLTVCAIYYLGKELYDQRIGILSALLLSFSSYHIIYSKYVMLESALIFFIICSLYFFWMNYKEPTNTKYAVFCGIFIGLAISTKYVGLLLYVVFISFTLLDNLRTTSYLSIKSLLEKRYIIIFLISLLVFSPFLLQIIINSVNPFSYQLFGRFKLGNPNYIQYPSYLEMIISGFNQYVGTIIDNNGLATISLPWLFIFQISAQFLFLFTLLYYVRNIKTPNSSYIFTFYLIFNIFVFFYGARHQNYQLWAFPAFLVMLSQLIVVSIDAFRHKERHKDLFTYIILIFSIVFIFSYIWVGTAAPIMNKDSEWKISGYEYATKFVFNKINKGDIIATDAPFYLEYLATKNNYDLAKNENILFTFYKIDQAKKTAEVNRLDLSMVRPRFLVLKGFNYRFLATRDDQKNIEMHYDMVLLQNDIYVFLLKNP